MRREVWRLLIQSKRFYVNTFRFAESALVFSLMLSVLLSIGLIAVYFHMAERHYYATNGAVPPSELTAVDAPNLTSSPLLADDPTTDDDEKAVPN